MVEKSRSDLTEQVRREVVRYLYCDGSTSDADVHRKFDSFDELEQFFVNEDVKTLIGSAEGATRARPRRALSEAAALRKAADKAEKLVEALKALPPPALDLFELYSGFLPKTDHPIEFVEKIGNKLRSAAGFNERTADGLDPPATKTDYPARAVARAAAWMFLERRREMPSGGHDEDDEPTSRFGEFVQSLFSWLGIRTRWKLPAEAAVRDLRKAVGS